MIFYFHGFSSGSRSQKAIAVKNYLRNYPVIIPEYPSHQPVASVIYLKEGIESQLTENPGQKIMLIGSSLGGYYAQYLATQYDAVCAVVLVNPCLEPTVTLVSQIGEQVNSVTQQMFHFTRQHFDELCQFEVRESDMCSNNLVLLDEGDDIIDYRVAVSKYERIGKVIVYPGGDHWFRHLDEALPEIEAFYKTHVGN